MKLLSSINTRGKNDLVLDVVISAILKEFDLLERTCMKVEQIKEAKEK